jgi:hypothetical protein
MTAYRQQALACAAALVGGAKRLRDLCAVSPDAPKIMRWNVYGWFERTERGVYALTKVGSEALERWAQAMALGPIAKTKSGGASSLDADGRNPV